MTPDTVSALSQSPPSFDEETLERVARVAAGLDEMQWRLLKKTDLKAAEILTGRARSVIRLLGPMLRNAQREKDAALLDAEAKRLRSLLTGDPVMAHDRRSSAAPRRARSWQTGRRLAGRRHYHDGMQVLRPPMDTGASAMTTPSEPVLTRESIERYLETHDLFVPESAADLIRSLLTRLEKTERQNKALTSALYLALRPLSLKEPT